MRFSTRPVPDPAGPGQESVWDYPRPPRVEAVDAHITVVLGGIVIVDTVDAQRVLETSHPPNYYVPLRDVVAGALVSGERSSFCEWKGRAHYVTVYGGDRIEADAAWGYESPSPAFASLREHVAFYADRMDACFVNGERVIPQPGGFYGGWITEGVIGPFKGGPGSRGW